MDALVISISWPNTERHKTLDEPKDSDVDHLVDPTVSHVDVDRSHTLLLKKQTHPSKRSIKRIAEVWVIASPMRSWLLMSFVSHTPLELKTCRSEIFHSSNKTYDHDWCLASSIHPTFFFIWYGMNQHDIHSIQATPSTSRSWSFLVVFLSLFPPLWKDFPSTYHQSR